MKTLTNVILTTCFSSCISCANTVKTVHSSNVYQTEKHEICDINTIFTISSIDIVYHQITGKPYAEIHASDNLMQYIVLDDTDGKFTASFKKGIAVEGKQYCRIDVYSPSVTSFVTCASGDISIPKGLKGKVKVGLSTQGSGDIDCAFVECESFKAETSASGDIEVKDVECITFQVATSASGDLTLNEVVCQNALLSVNASGDCHIAQLKCKDSVKGEVNASGDLRVSGTCRTAVLGNNASGDLEAGKLKAVEMKAELHASGDISCYASHTLTAKASGSGSLIYDGNPSQKQIKGKRVYKR